MRKFFVISAFLAILTMLLVPMAALAAYPTLNPSTYSAAGAYQLYNMDGQLVYTFRGMSVVFSGQSTNTVSGVLRLYAASTIKGTYLTGGTATIYLPAKLAEGNNTVVVMSAGGDLSLVLPAGVSAIATSGSAAVTGSPLTLAAGGTRTIPTTTSGLFTLQINRTYLTMGTFTGVIGDADFSKPRFQLAGSQVYATATDKTGTVTGSPVVCLAGNTTLNVTGAGTFDIAVPYGMEGTATSGSATVVGSPVTLPDGETTTIDTGATSGTVTIAMHLVSVYNISGTMNKNRAGAIVSLKGRIDGFFVTDNVNWTVYQMNAPIKLVLQP
jgi:hypothetical protein